MLHHSALSLLYLTELQFITSGCKNATRISQNFSRHESRKTLGFENFFRKTKPEKSQKDFFTKRLN